MTHVLAWKIHRHTVNIRCILIEAEHCLLSRNSPYEVHLKGSMQELAVWNLRAKVAGDET